MKFKFIGNAGGIFIGSSGSQILCDPWIVDGVFENSWYHYPPLQTKIDNLQKVDAIYISHIHPDHYDERYFDFPKNIPIIILDEGLNFLKKNLLKKGYNNLIMIKNEQAINFKEFKLTLYKPFSGHLYEESLLGNLIDSALVIQDKDTVAINFNDNTPTEECSKMLNKKYQKIDLAMLNYNTAGPYPSCFDNLSIKEKKNEHSRILKRNFNHLCKVIPLLKPKSVLPFAGSYVLGGKYFYKNEYSGTTTWDECASYLKSNLKFKTNVFCLRENQTYDIKNQKNIEKYEPIDLNEMKKYIQKIKDKKYDYENDKQPDEKKLKEDMKNASTKLKERIGKFDLKIKSNVFIKIKNELIQILNGTDESRKLVCELDSRLLRRILDRKSHWNNAEIGAHINFMRQPNKMDPDVHTSLSFFHL